MYIQGIARQLYHLIRRLEKLEQELNEQSPRTDEERCSLERQLLETRTELDRVKNILEGAKDS